MIAAIKRFFHRETVKYQSWPEFLEEWNKQGACDSCVRELEADTEFSEETEEEAQRQADEEAARMEYWDEDEEEDYDDPYNEDNEADGWYEPWPDEVGEH